MTKLILAALTLATASTAFASNDLGDAEHFTYGSKKLLRGVPKENEEATALAQKIHDVEETLGHRIGPEVLVNRETLYLEENDTADEPECILRSRIGHRRVECETHHHSALGGFLEIVITGKGDTTPYTESWCDSRQAIEAVGRGLDGRLTLYWYGFSAQAYKQKGSVFYLDLREQAREEMRTKLAEATRRIGRIKQCD